MESKLDSHVPEAESVEWGEPVRRWKVPRRTKAGDVTCKHFYACSRGRSWSFALADGFTHRCPVPVSTLGKAVPSCQQPTGVLGWRSLKAFSHQEYHPCPLTTGLVLQTHPSWLTILAVPPPGFIVRPSP